eukprot:TRINITY_DN1240_c0_g1_i2.p1 TRINITY_DN1240_c0_g1~~TRINITY_DN1240_c0_g1_i2.p1  ORF type:complete len:483 (-),score=115.03 TRINITY_DN1240_c0_g1_i2:34-1482(-)
MGFQIKQRFMEKIRKVAKVAVMQGNFMSLDFIENYKVLKDAVEAAITEESSLIICPELCITGTLCEDHYFEKDTETHSWEILATLLEKTVNDKIICAFGMPVSFNNALYDCMIYCHNHEILLIRPKTVLQDSGNSRQGRWFTPWVDNSEVSDFILPDIIRNIKKQETCKFGQAMLFTYDKVCLLPLIDNELLVPGIGSIECLAGAEIVLHSAASYHEMGNYEKELKILQNFSKINKCTILHANPLGCDGGRVYYEGGSTILSGGELLSQAPRFSLNRFNISYAIIDFEENRLSRTADKQWGAYTTVNSQSNQFINVTFELLQHSIKNKKPTEPLKEEIKPLPIHQELAFCSGGWLWDYLRHARAIGFFIPLSGGADSAACSTILAVLSERLFAEYQKNNAFVISELKRIADDENFAPSSKKDILSKLLVTSYLGTVNSSKETRYRAKALTVEFGNLHYDGTCLLYTSPSPRDLSTSRMPSSA